MDELHADYGLNAQPEATTLWAELAAAAKLPAETGGASLGLSLDSSAAPVLARVLPALLEQLRMDEGARARYATELTALLQTLSPLALSKALETLDIADRRRAIHTAAGVLLLEALVPLVVAAAPAYGQVLSPYCGELLSKLAGSIRTADASAAERGEAGYRELLQGVNDRWAASLLNIGATGYALLFHEEGPAAAPAALAPSATRLLQTSLETGAVGPMVWLALRAAGESEHGVRGVVELLKSAEPTLASKVITEQIATTPRLSLLLREQPIDWAAVDALAAQLGANAARPLLDQLVIADARATRRAIMDRLAQIGPEIRGAVLERIGDERWYVVRNMVVLLREAACAIEPALGDSLAAHPDARVRREALLLRLEQATARERALSDALRDADKQVLRTALHAAGSSLPPSGVLVLARRVSEPGFPAELRTIALILLGRSNAPAALEALLRVADGGRTFLGRSQLAAKTPELLAALTGLARSWGRDPRAAEFLQLARRSNDPEILAAIRPVATAEGA